MCNPTRYSAMDFDQVERQARETDNFLAQAACVLGDEMHTDEHLDEVVEQARIEASFSVWADLTETLKEAKRLLLEPYEQEELEDLLDRIRVHIEEDNPKPTVTAACIPV